VYNLFAYNTIGESESHPGFLRYALRPKKELSIDDTTQKSVFYTARAEAEETVEHRAYNTIGSL